MICKTDSILFEWRSDEAADGWPTLSLFSVPHDDEGAPSFAESGGFVVGARSKGWVFHEHQRKHPLVPDSHFAGFTQPVIAIGVVEAAQSLRHGRSTSSKPTLAAQGWGTLGVVS